MDLFSPHAKSIITYSYLILSNHFVLETWATTPVESEAENPLACAEDILINKIT